LSAVAVAQGADSVTLSEIVVTPTRTEKAPFDTPYVVQRVTAEDIQTRQLSRSLPDALKETPGVMVQKTAYGQGSPFIRGFTGFRTLMLVDGIRLNNSVFREGPNQYWSTVDPLSVERLEVVKGPGAVLYGSDAVGGTVNAITQSRQGYGEGFLWDRHACYRFASAEGSHTGRGAISASVDRRFGVLAGGSAKAFGDLEAGRDMGEQRKTGYEEWDADFKAQYFPDADSELVLAHQHVDQDDIWRTHRTVFGQSWHGTTVGDDRKHIFDQDRDLTYLQFRARRIESAVEAVTASVSWQEQEEALDRVRSNRTREKQGFDVSTFGAWFQLESPSPFGRWTYGAEYYHDDVDSFARRYRADGVLSRTEVQGPVADEATYDLIGVFAQDDIPINDALDLIIGGRYTHAAVNANRVRDPQTGDPASMDEAWNSGVGSGRLLCRLDKPERWHLFAGVSQGFRAPNLSDLTRFDIARSGELETAVPALEPEEFLSSEIGVKARYENWSAEVAYFHTLIDGMIVRAPTGKTIDVAAEVTKRNAGDGHLHGVELGARWQFHPQFSTFGWLTWMEGELEQFATSAPRGEKAPISRLMPLTGQIGLRWDHPNRKFWAEAVTTLAARQDLLSPDDERDTQRIPPGGTPGYLVATVRGGWRPTPNTSLTAALENVSDEDYRIHGSGLNEPGRNVVVSFSVRF
jgi:hemoglobin/transferrin/lactoferrin receptor protein